MKLLLLLLHASAVQAPVPHVRDELPGDEGLVKGEVSTDGTVVFSSLRSGSVDTISSDDSSSEESGSSDDEDGFVRKHGEGHRDNMGDAYDDEAVELLELRSSYGPPALETYKLPDDQTMPKGGFTFEIVHPVDPRTIRTLEAMVAKTYSLQLTPDGIFKVEEGNRKTTLFPKRSSTRGSQVFYTLTFKEDGGSDGGELSTTDEGMFGVMGPPAEFSFHEGKSSGGFYLALKDQGLLMTTENHELTWDGDEFAKEGPPSKLWMLEWEAPDTTKAGHKGRLIKLNILETKIDEDYAKLDGFERLKFDLQQGLGSIFG